MPTRDGDVRERERGPRQTAAIATLIITVAAWCLSGCGGGGHAVAKAATPCSSAVRQGVLPDWARTGFSDPRPRMPHVLGASGRITAILFTYPLISSQTTVHNNKVLWVSRVPVNGSDLRITAQRMNSAQLIGSPVARAVTGGPGPSYVDLPSPGCWRLTLHWSGHADRLDLQYTTNRS